jgi:aryl-alcohol dehydrogenase-like predicted oxidoreductase
MARKVSPDEASAILKVGSAAGIELIDTASAYGSSEEVLGQIGTEAYRVVTKIAVGQGRQGVNRDWAIAEIAKSCGRLNLPSIYGVLLHRVGDLLGPNGQSVIEGLGIARGEGIVSRIGVSLYGPEEIGAVLEVMKPDIIQMPVNVFDRRLIHSPWLKRLKDEGVEIHARSAFLQGSLIMGHENLPSYLQGWSISFRTFEEWAQKVGVSLLQAAIQFPLSIDGIDKVVVGVDTEWQLEEIVSASSRLDLDYPDFQTTDLELINPVNWKK